MKIERGYKLRNDLTLYKTYNISFGIYPDTFEVDEWKNIIHLTSTNSHCCNPGDRIVAVWTDNGGEANSSSFNIWNEINGNPQFVTRTKKYSSKKWINFVIAQVLRNRKYFLTITVNSELLREVENTQPQVFENVIAYASNEHNKPLNGRIRNMKIETGEHIQFLLSYACKR